MFPVSLSISTLMSLLLNAIDSLEVSTSLALSEKVVYAFTGFLTSVFSGLGALQMPS
jgi:hypothetical protein